MKFFFQLIDFLFLFTESATATRSSDHVNQSPAPLSPLTKGQAGVPVRIITDPTTGLQYAVCPLVCPSVPIRGEVTATPLSPTLSLKGTDHTGTMTSSPANDSWWWSWLCNLRSHPRLINVKSPTTWLFAQQLVKWINKGKSKSLHNWSFVEDSCQKGPVMRKFFRCLGVIINCCTQQWKPSQIRHTSVYILHKAAIFRTISDHWCESVWWMFYLISWLVYLCTYF